MKKFTKLIVVIILFATIGFSIIVCDSGDNSTGENLGGDNSNGKNFNATKLIGLWKSDDGMYLRFSNIQSGIMINVYFGDNPDTLSGGTHNIEGNFIYTYTHSFKMSFEGEQLRVSEFLLLHGVTELSAWGPHGWITDLNGLYKKQ